MAQMPISLGVHGGWNGTKIDSKDIKGSTYSGYMLGAFARININKFYIEPAVNYVKNSSKFKFTEAIKMDYSSVKVPVLVGYKILKTGLLNLRVYAGPQVSFVTNKFKFDGDVIKDLLKDENKALWDVRIGAGIDVLSFSLDVDFEQGLKNISKEIKTPQVFNVTLGYRIF